MYITTYGILLTIFISDKLVSIMANTVSQRDLEAGDVIYRPIDGMQLANHYGVYVGDGFVIHFSRELGFCRMTFEEFAKDYNVSKKCYIYLLW